MEISVVVYIDIFSFCRKLKSHIRVEFDLCNVMTLGCIMMINKCMASSEIVFV